MKQYLQFLWLVIPLVLPLALRAQTIQVSGVVLDDETATPLPGVSITIKSTTTGVISEPDGTFSIMAPHDAILVFSYIGMLTQEIEVNNQSRLEVRMVTDAVNLSEVVVVGYGTQKKANLSGAVDQINTEQLENRPISNLSQGLQGLVPNFNVDFTGGEPGAAAQFNIRGFTSINGGSPLFVVDGVPYDANELNFLNPSDIASISVLKDASSAAIYGARGAFGVVLISTKTGKEDKISYSNYISMARPTVLPQPVTDPYIFLRIAELSTNNTPWDYNNYTDEEYLWARQRSDDPSIESVRLDPLNPNQYIYMGSQDWNDYFFRRNSFSQSHNLSFSGSKEKFNYFVSGNISGEGGLNKLTTDNWSRYALRSRLGFNPLPWLSLENNTNVYQTDRDAPTYPLANVYDLRPVDVATNPDGTWANTEAGRAAAQMVDGGRYLGSTYGFQTMNRANVTLFKGLLTLTGDATFKRIFGQIHQDGRPYAIGYGPTDVRLEGGEGYALEERTSDVYNAYNFYATVSKTLNKHQFQGIIGYNQESYIEDESFARRDKLIVGSLPYIGVASGEQTVGVEYVDWAVQGIFGRLNYIFDNKYIFEFNGRYDGTSRFPSNNRWGFFPSVSAAWIVSEEDFFTPVASILSTLKLRGSYGSLGNQSVNEYGYILNLPSGTTSYLINGDYQRYIGTPGLNVDPNNYSWEVVQTANAGIEVGFLKDRIFATMDYYVRNTKGMLAPGGELPGVLGTAVPQGNVADLQTKGWELSIQLRNKWMVNNKPLDYQVSLTLADSKSQITKYPNDELLFSGAYYPGQQIGEIWGLQSDGFYKSAAEIDQLDETNIIPWGALAIVPGWPRYIDQDGSGTIDKGISVNDPKDYVIIGNSQPRYRFGVDLNASWQGFDARLYFQGVGKRDYYPIHYLFWGLYQQPYANVYPQLLDFYRPSDDSESDRSQHSQAYLDAGLDQANTDAEYPILQAWLADYRVDNGLAIPQTKYLLNAAYVRLKNVTVGYTLPATLTNRFGISRFRIFLSGENIWEASQIARTVDPEAISTTGTNGGSWAGYAYPFQRRYSVGINLDF
ncbi:MAG: TonB-dependent receptor [Saprospiraceae bacterium]